MTITSSPSKRVDLRRLCDSRLRPKDYQTVGPASTDIGSRSHHRELFDESPAHPLPIAPCHRRLELAQAHIVSCGAHETKEVCTRSVEVSVPKSRGRTRRR